MQCTVRLGVSVRTHWLPPHETAFPFLEGDCCLQGREAPRGLQCAPQTPIPKCLVSQTFTLMFLSLSS